MEKAALKLETARTILRLAHKADVQQCVVEGYARDYLMINGQWQDHILTSLINRNWQPLN